MTEENSARDSELTLMALVARKYYLGGASKNQIAAQLYLSRFKVARLLEGARESGIVRFEIGLPGDINLNLSRELQEAFRLKRAVVIDDLDDDSQHLYTRLGDAAVALLAEVVTEGDFVGIASTRTMMGIHEPTVEIPRCTLVQLTGELPRLDASDVIGGIRSITRKTGGAAYVFYAPMVTSRENATESYLAQPELRMAFDLLPRLNTFITGVGDWSEGMSLIYDNLPEHSRIEARERGAVAEIVGVPIDAAGRTVHGSARRHIVAPDVEVLMGATNRIGVVFDPLKAPAVAVAIRAGLINTIVTHRAHAEALLAL